MMYPSRRLSLSAYTAMLALGCTLLCASAAQAGDFTKVTDNSALPTGNAAIANETGDGTATAFVVDYTNSSGTNVYAIYYVASPGSAPVKIADTQTPSPTGGGNFTNLSIPRVSGNNVIFGGSVRTSQTQNSGLYVGHGDGTLGIIVDSNTPDPLNSGSTFGVNPFAIAIDGTNVIFFNDESIYKTDTNGTPPVALLPQGVFTPAGVPLGPSSIKLKGNTYAFVGVDANGHEGLYAGTLDGGTPRTIIDSSVAEPTGQGNFSAETVNDDVEGSRYALSSDGSGIAFVGDVTNSEGNEQVTGVYFAATTGGTVSTVVLTDSAKPDGGTFGTIFELYIEGMDGVDICDGTAIYASAPNSSNVTRVIGNGDSLDGQTFSGIDMETNGGSRFAFEVNFSNATTGSEAVYVGSNGSAGFTPPAFFSGATALGNGVYYLVFPDGTLFGYYSYLSNPAYIYHFDLGYEYVFDANDGNDGVYLYDFASSSFFYTSPTFPFPYLYDFSLDTVLYYYPNASDPTNHYTTNPRYFYDYATGQIITL